MLNKNSFDINPTFIFSFTFIDSIDAFDWKNLQRTWKLTIFGHFLKGFRNIFSIDF